MKTNRMVAVLLAGILLLACCESYWRPTPTPPSLERLIDILQDPDSPDFGFATEELEKVGPAAAPAAKTLAKALQYPRRDSYMAGFALIAMGPAAETAIPELIQALGSERPDVRRYAAFVLGSIAESARCAVPELAQRLWDSDPWVRTTAAAALDAITGVDLVDWAYKLNPESQGSVGGDEPEGFITARARAWWLMEGQYSDWSRKPNPCQADDP